MPQTGHGGTITIAGAGFLFRSIDMGEISVPVIDTSDLSTTGYATKIPGDLKEPLTCDCEILYNTEDSEFMDALVGVVKTGATGISIVYPIQTAGNAVAAKINGEGFVSSVTPGSMATGEVITASMTVQFNGNASFPPTFVQEVVA